MMNQIIELTILELNNMPNILLQLILKNAGQKWSANDLLIWLDYFPFADNKDYITRVANVFK